MNSATIIIVSFYAISFLALCIVSFLLYKKLKTKNEKLKLIIPILLAILLAIIFYLLGWHVPSCRIGKFS